MAKKDISLDGGGNIEFVDNTAEVLGELSDKVSQALEAMAEKAEDYAKGLCPVRTGRLRNSITHTISGAGAMTRVYQNSGGDSFGQSIGAADSEKSAYIGTNVEYAAIVEMNDNAHHETGQAHYLRDAVTNHASEYQQIAEEYLK